VAILTDDADLTAEEVAGRFAWARRRGRPAWIWPDIQIDNWRRALDNIEGALAALLAGANEVELDGDSAAIGLAGYTSGSGPLLGYWVEQGRLSVSGPIAAVLKRHMDHSRVRTTRMTAAAAELVDHLAREGIPSMILKGAHTGEVYFPEPATRPASDVDLLVADHNVARAQIVLGRSGFFCTSRGRLESTWRSVGVRPEPRSLVYVHAEDAWSFDLHHSLNISVGQGAPLAALDLARPMGSPASWRGSPCSKVLDQPLLLLHLATHAGAGWQNLTLLRLVELVLVIRRDVAAGELSWDAFLELGRWTEALGYAYPALCLADRLAPSVPRDVLARCAEYAPRAVRAAVARMTPASAQRIDRNSIEEHFMWATGWSGRLRMLAADLVPADRSWLELRRIYEARAWSFIRGTITS
jgi:hypothetical protein